MAAARPTIGPVDARVIQRPLKPSAFHTEQRGTYGNTGWNVSQDDGGRRRNGLPPAPASTMPPAAPAPLEASALYFRSKHTVANFVTIEAEARDRAGKGAARASRRAGKVPAVIYGAKQTPALVQLDPRVVMRELVRGGWKSRLYEVTVDGTPSRALMREVQFHPVSDAPMHVDFQRLAAGEKIRISVSVQFINEPASPGLKRGGVLNVVRHAVDVLADPENVPEHFVADLTGLDINDNVRFGNLTGTENVTPVITTRDFVIATVAPTKGMEAAATETAAAAAPAKGKAPAKGAAPAAAAKAPAKSAAKK